MPDPDRDWVELPDGSHMARGTGPNGAMGTFWIRHDSSVPQSPWVLTWEPDSAIPKEVI